MVVPCKNLGLKLDYHQLRISIGLRLGANICVRATRLIPTLRNEESLYEERLETLKLPTLEFRRRRGAMIEIYKLRNFLCDKEASHGLIELSH